MKPLSALRGKCILSDPAVKTPKMGSSGTQEGGAAASEGPQQVSSSPLMRPGEAPQGVHPSLEQ